MWARHRAASRRDSSGSFAADRMTICRDQIRTRSRDLLYDWHTQAVTLRRPIPTRLDEDEIGDEVVSGYTAMPQTREELAPLLASAPSHSSTQHGGRSTNRRRVSRADMDDLAASGDGR